MHIGTRYCYVNNIKDINALPVIDVKTAFMDKKDAWMFQLVEPDNGNENRDIHGRVFTTNICVYRKDETEVFGVRREKDATMI